MGGMERTRHPQGTDAPTVRLLYLFFGRKWTDGRVDEVGVGKLGAIARQFAGYGKQPRGERLVPFDGERGDVADDARQVFHCGVAGKRNSVEASGANGGVAEQCVERKAPLVPALG